MFHILVDVCCLEKVTRIQEEIHRDGRISLIDFGRIYNNDRESVNDIRHIDVELTGH
jgi:hypothetical protein